VRKYLVLTFIAILALAVSGCLFQPAPTPPPTKAVLTGKVTVPQGAVRQAGGQALPGATVNIIDPVTGNIVATTTTDADGNYQVEVPPGGPYIIEAVKGSIKVLDVSPQVEVGESYDLGTADATSTAVALVFQAKVEAGEDPAEINLDEIAEDPKIEELAQAVEEALAAGEDPTTAPEVTQIVELIVNPPAPTPAPPSGPTASPTPTPTISPTPTYTVTFTITPEEAADATVEVKDGEGNVVKPVEEGGYVYKLAPGTYTYTVSKTGYVTQTGEFTVVNKDLTITVNLELVTYYTLTLTGDGLSSVPPAGEIPANTSVTITVTPPEGKQVATFTVNGEDKKDDLVAADGTYTYTFTITGDTTIVVTYEDIPDTTPPTLESLTAYLDPSGTRAAEIVDGKWTLEWTVGEKVDHIEAIASEPVKLAVAEDQAVVTMSGEGKTPDTNTTQTIPEGTPYGTIAVYPTDAKKLIITPDSGNQTAALAGTFTFTVAAGVVEDLAGNKNAAISVILKVGAPVYNETQEKYYTTLQAAISDASSNDILHLAPGEFTITSNIEIAQPITILGNNSDINPNFSGRKPESILKSIVGENYYIDIQSSDVTIKGIKTDNVRINGYKPNFTSKSNILIENNIFTNIQGAAIHFRDASDAVAYNSSNVNIINNLIDGTDWIGDDPFDGGSGIVLWGVYDSEVSGNTVKNVYLSGIQFARDKDITVENNTVETSNYSAIIVAQWNSGVITINRNTLSATNRAVLYFWGFSNKEAHHPEIKVINNTIKNGPYGIQIGYAGAGAGYNDIRDADYDLRNNTFTNIGLYNLIIYLNTNPSVDDLAEINNLFSQVYGEGSTAKCIHDVDPFTYVVE